MGLFDFFRRRRASNTVSKSITVKGTAAPQKVRTRDWMFWRRTDYTLANSELLFAAVSRISNSLSAMPIKLYKENAPAKDHPLYDMISFAPNASMTSCNFFRTMEACRCSAGNCYALKVFGPGNSLKGLVVLDPARVHPIMEEESGELWYRISPAVGEEFIVHGYYILHVPFLSTNGMVGINPVSVLFDTISYAEQIQSFSRDQLEKGINAAVVLEAPTNISPEQQEQVIEDFMNTYKNTGGRILLLESGMTAKKLDLSPVDTKLFEVEKITRSSVAMVYNLPPHLLGDYSETSYNSQEQQMLEFLQLTMLPIVTSYEQELNRKLLTAKERANGYHFRFDMTTILRADAATQAEVNYKAVRSGYRTVDEIRAGNGDPPLPDGIGSEALVSQDLAPLKYTVQTKPAVLAAKLDRSTGDGGEAPPTE